MPLIKGILTFPTLFTPKVAKGATEPKFSCGVLLPATDPQVATIKAEVEQAKLNTFPNGYSGADECLTLYDTKYAGKDYYDPRFSGWYVFTCSAKQDDRPAVVDMNRQPIIDPAAVFSGMVGYVSAGISGYTKGKGGIGGWLNGVMITEEEPPMGRLDNKPSVDQMFSSVGANGQTAAPPAAPGNTATGLVMTAAANGMTYDQYKAAGWTDEQMISQGVASAPPATTNPAPPSPPAAPDAPAPPSAPAQLIMTAAANGMTYDQYKAAGWTDEQMISQGVAQKPSFS